MSKLVICAVSLMIPAGLMQPAVASPLIFAFEGNVTFVDPPLAGTFNTAQTLWGYYIFESTTPDNDPNSASGVYPALTDLSATVGSYTATWDGQGGGIIVRNGSTNDSYQPNASLSGPIVDGFDPSVFLIVLQDNSKTAFSSDALPSSLDLSLFGDVNRWELHFSNPTNFFDPNAFMYGELTSLQLVKEVPGPPVPEPSTAMLLLAAIPILAAVRRSKTKPQPRENTARQEGGARLKHFFRGAALKPWAAIVWTTALASTLSGAVISSSDCFPPLDPGAAYAGRVLSWPGFTMNNPALGQFSACLAPPANVGDTTVHLFNAIFEADFLNPDGAQVHATGTAAAQIQLQKVQKVQRALALGDISVYDAVILQLEIDFGLLLPAVRIRANPAMASLGQTVIEDLGRSAFGIDSFFDVFTELSVDGGQTWIRSLESTRMDLQTIPEPATLVMLGIGLVAIARFRRRIAEPSAAARFSPAGRYGGPDEYSLPACRHCTAFLRR